MNTLNNLTSKDSYDNWEVGYYDTDWKGCKLAGPQLGVRVNGGTWLEVDALLDYITDVCPGILE